VSPGSCIPATSFCALPYGCFYSAPKARKPFLPLAHIHAYCLVGRIITLISTCCLPLSRPSSLLQIQNPGNKCKTEHVKPPVWTYPEACKFFIRSLPSTYVDRSVVLNSQKAFLPRPSVPVPAGTVPCAPHRRHDHLPRCYDHFSIVHR
jgi:hypothetical protein